MSAGGQPPLASCANKRLQIQMREGSILRNEFYDWFTSSWNITSEFEIHDVWSSVRYYALVIIIMLIFY